MQTRSILKIFPARIILSSIIFTICIGTFLLSLPISRTTSIPVIDLLFTATSVTCVTGLLTVPLTSFTTFGHCVILILMQIGGLGLVTLTIFLISLFIEPGFSAQLMAGQLLELESWKNVKKILYFIIFFTLIIELVGAFFIFISFYQEYSFLRGCFLALFHAVSAFCSAGLSLFPNNLELYQSNYLLLITCICLMLAGGLGFITWQELFKYAKSIIQKKRFHISLHTQIVLITTSSLICVATVLFWILERNNAFEHMSPLLSLLNSLFYAISCKSTGLSTVPTTELQMATLFVIMIITFIGSSPGSTGSGIKNTTFAVYLAMLKAAVLGHATISMRGRTIARDQAYKAFAIVALSIMWIAITIFFLLITEPGVDFGAIIFEVVSAFATLGLSTGITPQLSLLGKMFIIITMITGRIGVFGIILSLIKKPEAPEFSYPEERLMIG